MFSEDQAMKYTILLQQSEEGYSVSCPGLPGCWSQGATEEEALANIEDAIREYLAAAAELAQQAHSPAPGGRSGRRAGPGVPGCSTSRARGARVRPPPHPGSDRTRPAGRRPGR